jgi:hypothetical protein
MPPTACCQRLPAPAKDMIVTPEQVRKQLQSLGNEAVRKQYAQWAAGGNPPGAQQFGVQQLGVQQLGVEHGAIRAGEQDRFGVPIW